MADIGDYQDDEFFEGEGFTEETYEGADGDPDIMKKRVQEMEDELDKLNKMQQQVESQISTAADSVDEKSIYVGQVDYESNPQELKAHFSPCGTVNRVTIICDKHSGHPKGFAYIEFANKESVENALKLDDSTFRGRQIKVLPKRQNIPVIAVRGRGGRGPPRGRGGRGAPYYPPPAPYYRGGGGGGRGRGRGAPPPWAAPRGGYRGGRGGRVSAYYNQGYY